jgi:hypothetical protein
VIGVEGFDAPPLRACEAGVAIHFSLITEGPALDCFVAALLAMTASRL